MQINFHQQQQQQQQQQKNGKFVCHCYPSLK